MLGNSNNRIQKNLQTKGEKDLPIHSQQMGLKYDQYLKIRFQKEDEIE